MRPLLKYFLVSAMFWSTHALSQIRWEEGQDQQGQQNYGDYDIQTQPLNIRSYDNGAPYELGILKTVQESTGQRLVGLVLKSIDLEVIALPSNGYNSLTVEADGQVIEQQYLNPGNQRIHVRLPYPQVIGGQGIRRLALSLNGNLILGSIRLQVSNNNFPGPGPGPGPGPFPDPRPDPRPDYGPLVVTGKILSSYNERVSLNDLLASDGQYPNPNRYVSELTVAARSRDGYGNQRGARLMVVVRGQGNVLSIDISQYSYPKTIRLRNTPLEDITFRVVGSDIYLEQMIIR
ncbi:MAG: hypothetical protein QE271_02245 [Bacteriovoracaceae bacterium]|nr:hypothetical protein [Bacteriovoracaceae bacterium]